MLLLLLPHTMLLLVLLVSVVIGRAASSKDSLVIDCAAWCCTQRLEWSKGWNHNARLGNISVKPVGEFTRRDKN